MAPPFVERYREAFGRTWDGGTPIARVRFVVLDSETTGLNPRTDKVITIGAVAVQDGEIVLEDSFDALVKVAYDGSSVTVHGVTRDESARGLDEAVALEGFIDYLRDAVIVGHHIAHDVSTLDVACTRHWDFTLLNRVLDTMDLTLYLESAGAFGGRPPIRHFTLDALCGMFGVIPHDRHTAGGDAFLTAQVFQRLLRLAVRHDRATLDRICEPFPIPAD